MRTLSAPLMHDAQANDTVFQVAVPILDEAQGAPIGAVELVIRRSPNPIIPTVTSNE